MIIFIEPSAKIKFTVNGIHNLFLTGMTTNLNFSREILKSVISDQKLSIRLDHKCEIENPKLLFTYKVIYFCICSLAYFLVADPLCGCTGAGILVVEVAIKKFLNHLFFIPIQLKNEDNNVQSSSNSPKMLK